MRILILGDIVGKPGREAVARVVRELRDRGEVDLVIANAENATDGRGLTPKHAVELLGAGVDVLTLGDHAWDRPEVAETMREMDVVLRPANFPEEAPGRGVVRLQVQGTPVWIAIVMTRTFMRPVADCPFRAVRRILDMVGEEPLFLEVHGETTSEKAALAYLADGKAVLVYGTHTHVPTADLRRLPGGTYFVTDIGMCGPVDSVIGMAVEPVLERFTVGFGERLRVAKGPASVHGLWVVWSREEGIQECRPFARRVDE